MTDDLVKRLRDGHVCSIAQNSCRNGYAISLAADRIEALTAENFKLAAGSCDVEGGKVGDEHGHFYCTLQKKVEAQAAEIERLNALIAATADHWMALQFKHPIAWDGAIDEAMAAACAKICELTEQHEAFKQEASDAVEERFKGFEAQYGCLERFVIPKPKPDPIAEAWIEATGNTVGMKPLNAALEARGLKIVENN